MAKAQSARDAAARRAAEMAGRRLFSISKRRAGFWPRLCSTPASTAARLGSAATTTASPIISREGAKARLKPNVVFDPAWYCARNPEVGEADPLLHYALIGEAAGRDPSPLFDVAWYRATYAAERPLAHYLEHRFGPFSPVPEFDAAFYLTNYPDVGAARLDPFLHYLHFGFREFRKPHAGFNPRRHAMRHGGGNPVVFPARQSGGGARAAARRAL